MPHAHVLGTGTLFSDNLKIDAALAHLLFLCFLPDRPTLVPLKQYTL